MAWVTQEDSELTRQPMRHITLVAAFLLLALAGSAGAQTRIGDTAFPQPADGGTRRFPAVAYDATNDAYLVVWGIGDARVRTASPIGARFVGADGTPLGSPVTVNTTGISPQVDGVRVACGPTACLVAWVEEPCTIAGRLLRYSNGDVQLLADQFVINANNNAKLSSAAPAVAFASAANEYLVAWTEFTGNAGGPDLKAQRVNADGSLAGPEIPLAVEPLYEGFPSLTYNSAQNEYMVAYYWESGASSNVGTQRVQPGTGALIGGRNTVYGSLFDQYPEITYNSQQNAYLAITWGFASSSSWMLHGRLADGNAEPLGGSVLSLALGGGGNGVGVAHNPVTNTYFCVYLNQNRSNTQDGNEVWGVMVDANGTPGAQFQVTFSGTRLSTQPSVAANTGSTRWLAVASETYAQIMSQLVEQGPVTTPPSVCPGSPPDVGWTCDPATGNWLPPGTTPPTGTSSCTTLQPAPDWICVAGNWLPPGTTPPTGTSSCTTVQPAPDWICVAGNWLPPVSSAGGSCPGTAPAAGWVCFGGNWLPPNHPLLIGG